MNSLYGRFRQNSFSEVFFSEESFRIDFNNSGAKIINDTINVKYPITDNQLKSVYYLLYANYGNSIIASSDTNRFKEKLFSLIVQYTPNLFKQLEVQDKLRSMTEEEILSGSSSIVNNAQNPNDIGSTEELNYISNQQTNKFKKGLISGYQDIIVSLKSDYIQYFIEKFKNLFLVVIEPEELLLYESGE